MNSNSIYGEYAPYLEMVLQELEKRFKNFDDYVWFRAHYHPYQVR